MRHYESIFLLKPTLEEEETKTRIEFFRTLVTENGGTIAGFDDIGMRTLAYEVKHNKRGYYYVMYFTSSNFAIVDTLQKSYRITEDVLKFMTIKFSKQTEIKAWDNMVKKISPPQLIKPEFKKDDRDDRGGYKGRGGARDTRGRDTRDNRGRDDRGRDDRTPQSRPATAPSESAPSDAPKTEEPKES